MALSFYPGPNAEEDLWRKKAIQFKKESISPTALEDDERALFRRDAFTQMAAMGLSSVSVPKEYGGQGQSYRAYLAVVEEVARGSGAMAVAIAVTNLIHGALLAFGTETQKKELLPRLAKGEWLGAFSLSESGAGSDAANLSLSAKREGNQFRLNGTKMWCSNGGIADLYLVMARTGENGPKGISSFLIPKDTPGFRIGKQEKKLGLRASTLSELIFEDCVVNESTLLGREGEGFKVALSQLDLGRIGIGVVGLGLTIEALERFLETKPVPSDLELVADHYANAQAVRSLIQTVATQRENNGEISSLASQIKLLGSDLAMRATSDIITLLGMKGVVKENVFERLMRDAKALQIVEGTNQIQRLVLAKWLGRDFS